MRAVLVSSVVLAVAACSPPASNTDEQSGATTQSAPAAASAAGEQLRLGRWRKTITVMGQQTVEVDCVTTADLNQLATEPNSHCTSVNGFQRTAEGLVYEAECSGEDGGGRIRTVMNGDLQNRYTA